MSVTSRIPKSFTQGKLAASAILPSGLAVPYPDEPTPTSQTGEMLIDWETEVRLRSLVAEGENLQQELDNAVNEFNQQIANLQSQIDVINEELQNLLKPPVFWQSPDPSDYVLTMEGAVGQVANLTNWQDSSGNKLLVVSSLGALLWGALGRTYFGPNAGIDGQFRIGWADGAGYPDNTWDIGDVGLGNGVAGLAKHSASGQHANDYAFASDGNFTYVHTHNGGQMLHRVDGVGDLLTISKSGAMVAGYDPSQVPFSVQPAPGQATWVALIGSAYIGLNRFVVNTNDPNQVPLEVNNPPGQINPMAIVHCTGGADFTIRADGSITAGWASPAPQNRFFCGSYRIETYQTAQNGNFQFDNMNALRPHLSTGANATGSDGLMMGLYNPNPTSGAGTETFSWGRAIAPGSGISDFSIFMGGGIAVGESGNTGGFGNQHALMGGGDGPMIYLQNRGTAPSSNPVGAGILYAEAGALKWRGSSGTVTVLAPA